MLGFCARLELRYTHLEGGIVCGFGFVLNPFELVLTSALNVLIGSGLCVILTATLTALQPYSVLRSVDELHRVASAL